MNHTLYVGNLPKSATELEVREIFARAGTVNSVAIVTDQWRGRSRRFGLVDMLNRVEAQKAIDRLNMTLFDDALISVTFSRLDQQCASSER